MAKVLLLFYLFAAAIYCTTLTMAASVVPISLKLLNEIQSNRTVPVPWVIRFAAPNGQTEKERQAFNDAAMLVDGSVAQFGVFSVDSYDKARFIENMGIRQLPSTRFVQYKAIRPTGPKVSLSGRPIFMLIDLPNGSTSDDIVRNALIHTSMRYHHPVTNQPVPSVTYVMSLDDLVERAKLTLPNTAAGDVGHDALANVGGGNSAKAVIFYFHLMKKNHLSTHAEINSLASRLGPRITVFATEDADIAKRFGLTTTFSAAAFNLKDVNVDASVRKFPEQIPTISTADELANAGACAAFAEEFAMPAEDYRKVLDTELQRWHKDLSAYYNKSPLSKITHSSQFIRDVMGNKASITVLFLLREADKLFNRYHRTAVDFAAFVRDPYRVAPGIYKKLHPNLNLQTYWIDGEVQDVASRFLNAKTVPSIAFLMHTQSGAVAVKYFTFSEEDKKRRKKLGKDMDWPDVQDLMAYVVGENIVQNVPGMSSFTLADVKFNDDIPASPSSLLYNNKYMATDRKHYHMGEEKPNNFLEELHDGKVTVEADHYAKEGAEDKTKKKSKKAAAKEEERKKKLQEELDRKKKEREERTKAKEDADKKRREEDAVRTKAEITAKAREEAKKNGGKRTVIEGESVTAPPLQPGRFKKDYNVWSKGWEVDRRKMVDKFVKNIKGGIRVGKGLSVPDWKKK